MRDERRRRRSRRSSKGIGKTGRAGLGGRHLPNVKGSPGRPYRKRKPFPTRLVGGGTLLFSLVMVAPLCHYHFEYTSNSQDHVGLVDV